MKKNDKGFSLVELIVVVLIMAIIAVAMAPQVMKWVENSRRATDMQTVDAIVSATEVALTNSAAYEAATSAGANYQIACSDSGLSISNGTNAVASGFTSAVCENLGIATSNLSAIKLKSSGITVTVSVDASTGKVTSDVSSMLVNTDLE